MPTDRRSVREYDKNYRQWLAHKGLGHSHLEKPAMYARLGRVRGQRALCLGCGAGEECGHLAALGARVTGIDISKSLIDIARQHYPNIDFRVMDMERLKFPVCSFDLVYSSLTIHYVRDWRPLLRNVYRILKPGGTFLFSTHHPAYWGAGESTGSGLKHHLLGYSKHVKTGRICTYGDYLNTRKVHDTWFGSFRVTYYHKPFSEIFRDILSTHFELAEFAEPRPLPSSRKLDPGFYAKASRVPLFAVLKLIKPIKT